MAIPALLPIPYVFLVNPASLAVAVVSAALSLHLSDSLVGRAALALLPPVLFLLFHAPASPLTLQVRRQWDRLPPGLIRSPHLLADFVAKSLSAARDDNDGCELRLISDGDSCKDVSVVLHLDECGLVQLSNCIPWDMPLVAFAAILADARRHERQAVELVARMVNGQVVYLVACFGVVNAAQGCTLLRILTALNAVGTATQLRPFKCRNFIQRGRTEPKIKQIL